MQTYTNTESEDESETRDMGARMRCKNIPTFMTYRFRHLNFWLYASILFATFLLYTIFYFHKRVNNPEPFRILALGDSLTEGYYNYGRNFHPYATNLKHLFEAANITVEIEQRGISGERVVPRMVNRLRSLLKANVPYDWIIILGGTNDLADSVSADRIFKEGLEQMYTMSLDHSNAKTKLVVMTVLEMIYDLPSSDDDRDRCVLNTMIREYVTNTTDQSRICLVDLDKDIPYHTMNSKQERERIWDDGVHLTPAGYDRMGTLIFNAIKDKVQL